MKNIIQNQILFCAFILFMGLLSFSSCKKDDPATSDTGTLFFHFHNYLENNEVEDYNTVYTTAAGREISLSLGQLYLSHIQLVRADGSVYDVEGKKILQEQDGESYTIGEVPVGEYKSVRFHLGFDAADNQAAPSSDPDLLDHPEMWFGAAPQPDGYVFLHVKGMIDTTADGSGTPAQMQPFEYKFGTAANYIEVRLPEQTFTVVKDQAAFVHLLADYDLLFNGIALNQPANLSVLTAAGNAAVPGTWFTNNLAGLFRYEEE